MRRAPSRRLSAAPAKGERCQRNDHPGGMERNARREHVASGDRPYGRAGEKFVKVRHGFRMD